LLPPRPNHESDPGRPDSDSESSFGDVARDLVDKSGGLRGLPPLPTGPAVPPAAAAPAATPTPVPMPTLSNTPIPALANTNISPRHQLEAWLATMIKQGASDLILRANGRPSVRVDGKVSFLPGRVPPPGALLEVLKGILGEERIAQWKENGSADAALYFDGLGRFRLNAYKQMGEPAVVMRRIGEQAPNLDALDLPGEHL
jgi:hypothetical protein